MKERLEPDNERKMIENMIYGCSEASVPGVVDELKEFLKNQPYLGSVIRNTIKELVEKIIDQKNILDKDVHSKTPSDIERKDKEKQELSDKAIVLEKIKQGLPKLFL